MGTKWSTELELGVLDNYDFTITKAYFAPDQGYADGDVLLLQLYGKTNDPEYPETHIWLPLGKGWKSTDGGKTARHQSGDETRFFTKSSLIGTWIKRMIVDFGMEPVLEESGRDDPRVAASWVGLKFRIKRETVTYEGLDSSGPKSMPVAFLGIVDSPSASATVAPVTAAGSTAGETPEQKIARIRAQTQAKAGNGTASSLRDQVIAALKSEADAKAAESKALAIPGVVEDDMLLALVMDPDSELWQLARA
jgi:hypothetical protein